jgi:hypothetical protein
MTRPDCRVRGREELIFSHTQRSDGRLVAGPDDPPNSDIAIAYGCTENGEHSTLEADAGGGTVHLIRVAIGLGRIVAVVLPLIHFISQICSHIRHLLF